MAYVGRDPPGHNQDDIHENGKGNGALDNLESNESIIARLNPLDDELSKPYCCRYVPGSNFCVEYRRFGTLRKLLSSSFPDCCL